MAIAASSSVPAAVRLKELPAGWAAALAAAIASRSPEVVAHALRVARAAPAAPGDAAVLHDALRGLTRDSGTAIETRIDALTALAGGGTLDDGAFELLRSALAPSSPLAVRMSAAAAAEKAALSPAQLRMLLPAVEAAGPLELPRLLTAFERGGDEAVGLDLIAALGRARARAALRPEVVRPRLAKYPDSVKAAGERLLASLAEGDPAAARLDSLLAGMHGGDVARGRTVFNGARGACLTCHTIGYIGGRIGPDLTKIGQVRGSRDLLEAIVVPNASFARGYEPVVVRTRTGEEHAGVLRADTADEVVVGSATGAETRVPRRDVAAIEPGSISLMPSGYDELLTRQELTDLIAFLQAAR
jgi:putative heme-binding domain-containing protein